MLLLVLAGGATGCETSCNHWRSEMCDALKEGDPYDYERARKGVIQYCSPEIWENYSPCEDLDSDTSGTGRN